MVCKRDVRETFRGISRFAVFDRVRPEVYPARKCRGVGLVGDDTQRAGLGVGAVQAALRSGQSLDTRNVINTNVEIATDSRYRLIVEIQSNARRGSGEVAVTAVRDATHVDLRLSGAELLGGDRGQKLEVVGETRDVERFELRLTEHIDTQRHVLEVLCPLLRRDNNLLELEPLSQRHAAAGDQHAGRHPGRKRSRRKHAANTRGEWV